MPNTFVYGCPNPLYQPDSRVSSGELPPGNTLWAQIKITVPGQGPLEGSETVPEESLSWDQVA